jgi:hypothetical protein
MKTISEDHHVSMTRSLDKTILNKGFEELEKGTIGYGLFTGIKG